MSTEQPEPQAQDQAQDQVWGAAPRPEVRAKWSGRKTIAAVAIAVGIAGAGGATIYAATNGGTGDQRGGPGMGGPRMVGGPGGFGRDRAAALHGEFVVSDGNGGYRTELTQTGKVTAITSTSLTAASDDGFTQTYVLDGATAVDGGQLSDITTGDTVSVVANKAGDKATATALIEGGQRPATFPRRAGGNGAPPTR